MGLQEISAGELRKVFLDAFPMLGFQGMRSKLYWIPSLEKVKNVLSETKVERQTFLPDINDCDSFSLQLHADVKRLRAIDAEMGRIPRDQWMPWAFGEAFGIRFRGIQEKHSLNICYTKSGIYLIEPQTDHLWQPNPNDDIVLLIWM